MVTLEPQVLRCLAQLKSSTELKPLYDWLVDSLNKQRASNDSIGEEVQLRWGQGKAKQLSELIKAIDDARLNLNKVT